MSVKIVPFNSNICWSLPPKDWSPLARYLSAYLPHYQGPFESLPLLSDPHQRLWYDRLQILLLCVFNASFSKHVYFIVVFIALQVEEIGISVGRKADWPQFPASPQVTGKRFHLRVLYLAAGGNPTTRGFTLTACIGRCKSNYRRGTLPRTHCCLL